MADKNLRYSKYGSAARAEADPPERASADPLAELARLIGQGDPSRFRQEHDSEPENAGSGLDWAADAQYAEEPHPAEDRFEPPAGGFRSSYAAPDSNYAHGAEPGRFFSGSAAKFTGFRTEHDDHLQGVDAHPPGGEQAFFPRQPAAGFGTAGPEHHQDADAPAYYDDQPSAELSHPADAPFAAEHAYEADERDAEADGEEEYYDDAPPSRRRGGLIVVMAVLGLAVLGTAGAFGYRAMFGGSVLPSLPPIIKASDGPNKIMPSYGDAQSHNTNDASTPSTGSTEKLVTHEESPVDIPEPSKSTSHVVSTIPMPPAANSGPAGMAGASASLAPTSVFPPVVLPPAAPPQTAGTSAAASPPPAPASTTMPISSQPKKVHTVIIHSGQSGAGAVGTRSAARAAAVPAGGSAPLSLVPSSEGGPAVSSVRTHTAPAHFASASTGAPVSLGSGRGYAVQVTSQHSEAEAHAALRALRTKFPEQLGSRKAIVHRADLGSRGVYYRALVPFGSMGEATAMCSSLKAAGGTCIVQRD